MFKTIIDKWYAYEAVNAFENSTEDFYSNFRASFEMENDCLAGIMVSIEKDSDKPFLKYLQVCMEGCTKFTDKVTSFVPKNNEDEIAKQKLLQKMKVMSEILNMVKIAYK